MCVDRVAIDTPSSYGPGITDSDPPSLSLPGIGSASCWSLVTAGQRQPAASLLSRSADLAESLDQPSNQT